MISGSKIKPMNTFMNSQSQKLDKIKCEVGKQPCDASRMLNLRNTKPNLLFILKVVEGVIIFFLALMGDHYVPQLGLHSHKPQKQ